METSPRRLHAAALVTALALALSACGSDGDDGDGSSRATPGDAISATPAPQVTVAPAPEAKVIGITIGEDSVSPSGARIAVARNQPVVFEIDAVAAGELHVHSTPEKEISFPEGKSQVKVEFEQPGVVDVEDHGLDKLIVQLEVR